MGSYYLVPSPIHKMHLLRSYEEDIKEILSGSINRGNIVFVIFAGALKLAIRRNRRHET